MADHERLPRETWQEFLNDLLTASGLETPSHPPRDQKPQLPARPPEPRPRWRSRVRRRVTEARERFGLWAYWLITGDRISTDDDD